MSSVADTKTGSAELSGGGESLGTLGSTRANPLAVEIPVNATGTRPGSGPDKSDLFSEEANTVLVFPDGAVIRLSAAVATGQLIFLTNKKTNMEVVSQVVGKRVYRPTSCYVELKFTEAIEGFWGVEFPAKAEGPAQAAAGDEAGQETTYELVESSDAIEDGGTVAAVPTGKELEELREEVEVVRRRQRETKEAEASANSVAEMAGPDGRGTASEFATQNATSSYAEQKQEMIAPVNEPAPAAPTFRTAVPFEPAVVVTAPVQPVVARSSHVAMSLPNREPTKIDPEQEVLDQLLPQPSLDFSKVPIPSQDRDPNDPYSIYKPTRAKMGKWTLGILAVVLVGAVGFAAWEMGFVTRLVKFARRAIPAAGQAKQVAAGSKTPEAPKSAPAASVTPEAGAVVAVIPSVKEGDAEMPKAEASAPAPVSAEVKTVGVATVVDAAKKPVEKAALPAGVAKPENPALKSAAPKNAVSATAKKKGAVVKEPVVVPSEVAPVVEEGPLVPAKLLKAVSPVYPPDAMRNFITGDVMMKAEVDEKGQIRNMEVVSGPAALRSAAIEALKQYEYQPATKGGKGVASWVKVTIKFWFDP